MPLTVPAPSGQILMLQYILGLASVKTGFTASSTNGPVLRLFRNDPNPAISTATVLGDIAECTSAGYAPITLVSSGWSVSQPGGVTTGSYAQQAFTFGTNAVAYGYYVTDPANNLLWIERFSGAPFSIPDGGGSVTISSKITLG